MKLFLLIGMLALISGHAFGQADGACSARGQTPATAFPVCGTTVFVQDEVPVCENGIIPVTGCAFDGINYSDQSPFWYKFTCFESGTLGFLIDPVNNNDDYDWQLFDITGYEPAAVYSNSSLFVSGNWSGEGGNTGASSEGESNLVCATLRDGPYRPLFSKMPRLIKGHEYLLLVSHFSGAAQSGYKLSFGGGTAVITDTAAPRLKRAKAVCDGRSITLFLNKGMRCNSMAADGSDFKLLHTDVGIKAAYAGSCKNGFDLEQLTLELDGKLSPGEYTVVIQNGKDNNTLLDACGNGIPAGDTLEFVLPKLHPVPMDSVIQLGCAPRSIKVVFGGDMRCGSIAKDGSDFSIKNVNTGAFLTITGAEGVNCEDNLTNIFKIDLAAPVYQKGQYQLTLLTGSDGNSAISECDITSIPGQVIAFESYDTVSAVIEPVFQYACNKVNVQLANPGGNGINEWNWNLSSGLSGEEARLTYADTSFKTQQVRLRVSNGVCSDEQAMDLEFNQDYYLHADFEMPAFVCPQDPVSFKNKSKGGHITQWEWSFGNGKYGQLPEPRLQHYPVGLFTEKYPVELTITNSKGCRDTAKKIIKVINTCEVYVPTAFTPNDDGQNDYLYPLNAYLAKDLIFRVYNRYGQLVFQTKDWTQGWDGTFHDKPQPSGSYVWMLSFINSRTGHKVFRKGATLLIR